MWFCRVLRPLNFWSTANSLSLYATLRQTIKAVAGATFALLLITPTPNRMSRQAMGLSSMTDFRDASNRKRSDVRRRLIGALAVGAAFNSVPSIAVANNYGESLAWQFKTSADRANQAAILDLIAKHRGSFYVAPIYNTTIAQQNNCAITATATGNADSQTAQANSPTVSGATSTATGNSGTTSLSGRGDTSTIDQSNSGTVSSGIVGSTGASVRGDAWQALNSTQSNTGNQSASVSRSNACAFGSLN